MKKQSLFIFALSLAVFGVITTELGIIGLLPQVMKDFNIDVQEAGLLVSVYAVVVAVSGPLITLLMSGWNRKYVLIGILFLIRTLQPCVRHNARLHNHDDISNSASLDACCILFCCISSSHFYGSS